MDFNAFIQVGLGGAAGAVCRVGLGNWIQSRFPSLGLSAPTLAVNLMGCLLIGVLLGFADKGLLSTRIQWIGIVGFLGAFTTFSAFSANLLQLLKSNQIGMGLAYVGISVLAGLGLTILGYSLVQIFLKS